MKCSRPILIILTAIFGLTLFRLYSLSFGLVAQSIVNEFNLSYAEVSPIYAFYPYIPIPVIVVSAIVLDWRGGRILVILGSLVAALGGYCLSTLDSFSQFPIWYFVFSTGSAFFGGIVPFVILANWFARLRGIVIGITLAVASMGFLLLPLLEKLVSSFGWRTTYLILGIIPLVLIPLALFIKRRPEDDGASPDFNMASDRTTIKGEWSPFAARRYRPAYDAENLIAGFKAYSLSFGMNKGAVLGILTGFIFLFIVFIAYFSYSGTTIHMAPYMTASGASATARGLHLAFMGLTFTAGALVLGVLSDFLHVRFCLAASLLMFGFGTLIVNGNPLSIVGICIMGLGQGGFMCLVTIFLADYFGRGALGILRGFLGVFVVPAGIICPIVIGYIYDTTGSYSTGFVGMGVGLLICAGLAILLWPPNYEKLPIG